MYLISAYFDENSNRILQRYINHIAEETGNAFMTDHNVPPHMTISSLEARNVDVLIPPFEKIRDKNVLQTGEIQFVSVGQLLPYVMYATPVMNEYLLEMSKIFYEEYSCIDEVTVSKYYRSLSWLPHVTLGKTLDKAQMVKAFEVMQDCFVPFKAKIVEMGLAKVNPHEDVIRCML